MFNALNLKINRGSAGSNEPGHGTTVIHTYIDLDSTIATIKLYFPPNLGLGINDDMVFVDDFMFIAGSDGTILAPIITLVPFILGTDVFTGGTAITMGIPIVPVDGNGARISGGVLQMEIADLTHPGIMTAAPQEFGGAKTFHDNLTLVDPINGFVITKTIGSFGVDLITSDPNATPGVVFMDTGVPGAVFGMLYKRAGFSAANPQLYVLAGNNAGIIFDDVDGTVRINNTAIIDFLDSSVGQPISIGATNATVINLETNTAINPTKELLTNQIDSATAAPLVLGATNTTVAVMNKGVQFLSAGGTPATLNDYEEYDHNTTFTNNTETTASIDLFLVKTGDSIVLRNATVASVPGQLAPAAFFSADTPLPARFRPGQDCNGPFRVQNNGIFSDGWIEVTAAGAVNIYNNVDFTTAFTAAVTNGFSSGTFPYSN